MNYNNSVAKHLIFSVRLPNTWVSKFTVHFPPWKANQAQLWDKIMLAGDLVNIYWSVLVWGNVNSLTSVTEPRNRAVSVSSSRENKWGGVHVIITLKVCKCVRVPLGRVSIPLHGQICTITQQHDKNSDMVASLSYECSHFAVRQVKLRDPNEGLPYHHLSDFIFHFYAPCSRQSESGAMQTQLNLFHCDSHSLLFIYIHRLHQSWCRCLNVDVSQGSRCLTRALKVPFTSTDEVLNCSQSHSLTHLP